MPRRVATEIYCHSCDVYITIRMDMSFNGNHEIICPKCSHCHYRVVEDGVITGERWKSSMGTMGYSASYTSYSNASWMVTDTSSCSGATYLVRGLWGGCTST